MLFNFNFFASYLMAETMKITTLNCQGLARKSKCPDVLDFYMKKYYIV